MTRCLQSWFGLIILGTFLLPFWPGESVWASAGTSGGLLMATADTARGYALHGATGTLSDDAGAVFCNPAGLAGLTRISGLFTHQTGLASDWTEILNIAFPMADLGGIGATLVYHGFQPLDDAGEGIPAIDVNEKMAILSFGREESSLAEGLAYGVNLKALQSVLGEYTALAWAADIGLLWNPVPEASVGLVLKHVGTGLKFISAETPLPTSITLAGKYFFLADSAEHFYFAADIEYNREGDALLHCGGEFEYLQLLFLRAGYTIGPARTRGMAFGLGIQPKFGANSIRLDYAYRINAWSDDSFEGTQLITMGLLF